MQTKGLRPLLQRIELTYQKINESFYKISGTPEQIQTIKRKFTIKIPGGHFDPMIKRGFKPDSEVFYVQDGEDIIIPSGLVQFLGAFGITQENTPEFTEQEIKEFIKNLKIPFELYDYQELPVIECLMCKQQLALAATGCLDPLSKINVDISEEDYELVKEFRKH
jgi:hypothetical protein